MATPTSAELVKAADVAAQSKNLLARASKSVDRASRVLLNVQATLDRFDAHVAEIDDREKQLSAELPTLGNMAKVLDDTFRSDTSQQPVAVQPSEQAHLPQARAGNGAG